MTPIAESDATPPAQKDDARRVFLLGAGASVFAGYPLAAKLLDFVREGRSRNQQVREIAGQILEKLNDADFQFNRRVLRQNSDAPNLEALLTYLDLYGRFAGTPFDINPWSSADTDKVRRLITERFLAYQYDLALRANGSAAIEPLHCDQTSFDRVSAGWAAMVQPDDVIISFNWDILHESILWRAGLWSYRDGYGFQCGEQGNLDPLSKVLLLKLHGSVNWVQSGQCDQISEIANVADFFPNSKDFATRRHHDQAQTDSGRKLVLPTYIKDVSANPVLLSLWTKAHRFLSNAKELMIIGYSLNPADIAARLLVGTAVTSNKTLREIHVVTPSAIEWSESRKFGKPVKLVCKTFEDWVLHAASAIGSTTAAEM